MFKKIIKIVLLNQENGKLVARVRQLCKFLNNIVEDFILAKYYVSDWFKSIKQNSTGLFLKWNSLNQPKTLFSLMHIKIYNRFIKCSIIIECHPANPKDDIEFDIHFKDHHVPYTLIYKGFRLIYKNDHFQISPIGNFNISGIVTEFTVDVIKVPELRYIFTITSIGSNDSFLLAFDQNK